MTISQQVDFGGYIIYSIDDEIGRLGVIVPWREEGGCVACVEELVATIEVCPGYDGGETTT